MAFFISRSLKGRLPSVTCIFFSSRFTYSLEGRRSWCCFSELGGYVPNTYPYNDRWMIFSEADAGFSLDIFQVVQLSQKLEEKPVPAFWRFLRTHVTRPGKSDARSAFQPERAGNFSSYPGAAITQSVIASHMRGHAWHSSETHLFFFEHVTCDYPLLIASHGPHNRSRHRTCII